MKILQINTESTWRGGERQTLYTASGLLRAGVACDLLALSGCPLADRAAAAGVRVRSVPSRLDAWRFLARHGKDYDILHAQTSKGHSAAVLTKIFHRRPVLLTRRVDFRPRGFLWPRIRHAFTDRTVVISGFIRDVLADYGFPGAEVISSVVVPRELDAQHAAFIRSRAAEPGKKVVTAIAALDRFKDPLFMVDVVKIMAEKRNDFVFLHFGKGPLEEATKARIKDCGLEKVYKLMGFVENVEDIFACTDVFVMGSKMEGLGSSVLDAFAYRVPVASTDAGGLKETVADRGLLVESGDAAGLAGVIMKLLDDPELCLKLTGLGGAYVEENASIDASTQKYIRIYKSLITGKS